MGFSCIERKHPMIKHGFDELEKKKKEKEGVCGTGTGTACNLIHPFYYFYKTIKTNNIITSHIFFFNFKKFHFV